MLTSKRIKLIVFDWDDTFTTGATDAYVKCYHEALQQVGVTLGLEETKKRVINKWGRKVPEVFEELLKERLSLVREASEKYESILLGDSFVDSLEIVDGAIDMLEQLSQNYTLCIATGVNPVLLEEKIMPKFNVPAVFSEIISVYDLNNPMHIKPHPYMLQTIMKNQNVSLAETMYVGDAVGDLQMAKNAGVLFVAVLTGQMSSEEANNLGADYVIDDVSLLANVLVNL